jgi:uncharacterized protein YggU (UPF0235/DUF167 family)
MKNNTRPHNAPTTVRVRVVANAARERVVVEPKRYHITVTEKAKGGNANERVRVLLAQTLGVPLAQVRLVRGQNTPSKLFSVY